jgi:hypothetical protein
LYNKILKRVPKIKVILKKENVGRIDDIVEKV